jgi:WD40 repeat protein
MLVFGLALLLVAIAGPQVTVGGTQIGKSTPWWVQFALAVAGVLVIGWALLASRGSDQQLWVGPGFLGTPPRVPARLVARPELSEAIVAAMRSGAESVAVTGIGGAGKSTLAAQACQDSRVQASFRDGVTWLEAGPGKDPVTLLADLAERLGLSGAESSFSAVTHGRDKIAATQAGKRVLVALDNVWEREPVDALVGLASGFVVLYTTRLPDTALTFGSAEVPVDQLSGEQALELLSRWTSQDSAKLPTEARELCTRVGNLALGVAMAGAMTARGRSFPDILALVEQDPSLTGMDPPYPYATLFAAIRAGISDLPEPSRRRYEQLAVFARTSPFPRDAVEALWQPELSGAGAGDLLADLVGRSLLTSAGEGWYSAHDLQYELLGRELGPELLAAVHTRLLDGYRSRYDGWTMTAADPYLGRSLASHLTAAGRDGELAALLCDPAWITGRLANGQMQGLIADYTYSSDPVNAEIARALRLSAHVLSTAPWLARGQLAGRLLGHPDPRIADWAAALTANDGSRLWLAPLRTSLTPTTTAMRQVLAGHSRWVLSAAVTADGALAASGGTDGTIRVWDLRANSVRIFPAEHGGAVTALALTADGHTLASGGDDGVLRIWNPITGKLRFCLKDEGGAASALALADDGMTLVTSGDDALVRVWDLASRQQTAVLPGHADRVRGVAVTPDGKRALSGARDGSLRVWDLARAEQEAVLTGHDGSVLGVAVTPDGSLAVTCGGDGTVRVWDLAARRQRAVLAGHVGGVLSVAVASDRTLAVTAGSDGTVRTWDLPGERETAVLTGHDGWVRSAAMTADGRTAVTGGGDGTVRVWDLAGRQNSTNAGQDGGAAWAVAMSADAATAILGGSDGSLHTWDLAAARETLVLPGHGAISSLAVAGDGKIAVSGGGDGVVCLWILADGGSRIKLGGHDDWAWPVVAITPDGALALSGGGDGSVRVWDLTSRSQAAVLTGHESGVSAVAAAADGTLAVSGGEDGTVRAWELATARMTVLTGHQGWVPTVAVTADGRLAVSGGEDGTVRAWDTARGRATATLSGHKGAVRSVVLVPDGTLAVSGGDDGTVRVWDLAIGAELVRWAGDYAILSCAILPAPVLTIGVGERRRQPYLLELRRHA